MPKWCRDDGQVKCKLNHQLLVEEQKLRKIDKFYSNVGETFPQQGIVYTNMYLHHGTGLTSKYDTINHSYPNLLTTKVYNDMNLPDLAANR